jgi:hypothetical protein
MKIVYRNAVAFKTVLYCSVIPNHTEIYGMTLQGALHYFVAV